MYCSCDCGGSRWRHEPKRALAGPTYTLVSSLFKRIGFDYVSGMNEVSSSNQESTPEAPYQVAKNNFLP